MSDSSKFDAEIINQFDKTAENYSKDTIFSQGNDLDMVLNEANPINTMIVLDVATGAGHVAMKIAPFVKSVHAVDITPKMIGILEETISSKNIKNIYPKIMPADDLKFENDTFDIVTCRFATHHFTDVKKFLSEIKRVLKPNGKLIIGDIVAPSSKQMADFLNDVNKLRDHSHVREFSEEEWESMFLEKNFVVLNKQNNPIKHDLKSWFTRAKTSDEDRQKVLEKFNNSHEAQIQFQTDSKITSFVENSMIFTLQILT